MKLKFRTCAITCGSVDCCLGVILIAVQAAVTFYCNKIDYENHGRFQPDDILFDLGLASVGVWVGLCSLATGIVGIIAGRTQERPRVTVGSRQEPVRNHTKFVTIFFIFSIISTFFSAILVAVSAALTAEWFIYVLDPPLPHEYLRDTGTTIGSLCIIMIIIGLLTFPVNCLASYSCQQVIQRNRPVGKVVFASGLSRTDRKTGNRRIEVITRPASQITLSPRTLCVPQMTELSRNPSFQNAVRNGSQTSLRNLPQNESSAWSCDF